MKLLLLFVIIFTAINAFPQNNLAIEANQEYTAGHFENAISKYQDLLHFSGPSADIYYNLGLAYLKLDKVFEARLNFERALLLNPSSGLVKRGIKQSTAHIEPKIESLPPFILYKWFSSIRDLLPGNSWGWLFLFSALTLGLFGILNQLNTINTKSIFMYLLYGLFFLTGIFYFSRITFEAKPNCIISQNVNLRIAPDENSQILLPLGIGTKMEIIDSLQTWYKVTLENNDDGWLSKNVLSRI